MLMTSSCWNGGTFEKSTATPTMETEIVGVVGRLKTMEVPPLQTIRQCRSWGMSEWKAVPLILLNSKHVVCFRLRFPF